jgi:WD40 repeat protein
MPSRRLTVAICLVGLLAALAALAILLKAWQRGASEHGKEGETPRKQSGPVEPLELRREDIPPMLLTLAGGGDPAQAPPELAAVLGDSRFLLPRLASVTWMQQSPDEKTLAVPHGEDVVLFKVPSGKYVRSLKGPGGRVVWVSFSRDSQLLVAISWYEGVDGAVRVWDLRTDKMLFTVPVPGHKISGAITFSSDSKRLVGEGAERLQVWDAHTGAEVQTVPNIPGGCACLCFSPDGRRLAASIWHDRNVKIFDWDGERLGQSATLKGHSGPIGAVVYSPDGKWLASGAENEFTLWDAKSLREIRTVPTPAQELAFAPDSRTLYAAATVAKASLVHTFTRWDLGTQKKLPALSVKVSFEPVSAQHCLSRDGKILFVARGLAATYIRTIDTASGKELFPRQGHVAPLNAVAIGPDGTTLASAGEDQVVKLWNLASGRVLHSLAMHTQPVWGLAFSPNGELLATGSCDGTLALWDVASGGFVRALLGHSRSQSHIVFSPDGTSVAAGNEFGTVKRWHVANGNEASPLRGHSGVVRCVAFSSDGKWLASGGEDKSVRLHNLATGDAQKLATPTVVNQVAFSPDSRTLAAVGNAPDAAVRLWDIETGQETTWKGHTSDVHGLAFSPVGSLLATCADDGTVRIWDRKVAPAGVRTIGPGPFGGVVRAVAFTLDGRYLATANANGMVYLLRVGSPPQ